MPERHVAVYLRVSTHRQDLRSQEPDLRRWLAAYAGEQVRWYQDKQTGESMARPGWGKLEAALRRGEVERIVVWRLDRLGRASGPMAQLLDELIELDIPLISVTEGFDLRQPAGRLMARMLSSMAVYETEVRRDRQAAGIAAARAQGKRWGGRRRGERYKVTPAIERQVLALAAAGEPKASIARSLKLARQTVYDVLTRAAAA